MVQGKKPSKRGGRVERGVQLLTKSPDPPSKHQKSSRPEESFNEGDSNSGWSDRHHSKIAVGFWGFESLGYGASFCIGPTDSCTP